MTFSLALFCNDILISEVLLLFLSYSHYKKPASGRFFPRKRPAFSRTKSLLFLCFFLRKHRKKPSVSGTFFVPFRNHLFPVFLLGFLSLSKIEIIYIIVIFCKLFGKFRHFSGVKSQFSSSLVLHKLFSQILGQTTGNDSFLFFQKKEAVCFLCNLYKSLCEKKFDKCKNGQYNDRRFRATRLSGRKKAR